MAQKTNSKLNRYITPVNQERLLLRLMAALIPGVKYMLPESRKERDGIKHADIVRILDAVLRHPIFGENLPPYPKLHELKGSNAIFVDWYSYLASLLNWDLERRSINYRLDAIEVANLFERKPHSNKGYIVDTNTLRQYGLDMRNWFVKL